MTGTSTRSDDEGVRAVVELGEVMGEVARTLQHEHGDVERTLGAITSAAVRTMPDAVACGISYVVGRTRIQPRAATSDLPRQVDALQERLREGPCMSAIWDERTVRVDDIAADQRWPGFATEVAGMGVGSMLCFRLFVDGDTLGALNVYATLPHAFDAESEGIGHVFASHASIALAGAQQEQHLRSAMDSRDLIGQAKGILMERYKITGNEAFTMLVHASNRTNRKIADIADELSTTGVIARS
jgi:GAF domain-containing protein